jgi:alcohol dehydrogenase (cytochrome c)
VTDQELLKPDPSDWVGYSGTYNSHRHSLLKQITTDNVKNLQAKWVFQLVGQQHVQAVPIVADGVMYVAQFNRVDAIDARTGSLIWQYQRDPVSTGAQRGTAIHGNKVFVTTTDSKLVRSTRALGMLCGRWRRPANGIGLPASAPSLRKARSSSAGINRSGFFRPTTCETGKHLWTWNAVPTSSTDPGAETWAGDSWKLRRRSDVGERELRSGVEHDFLRDRSARFAVGG